MTEQTKEERYLGVECLSCGEPIPVMGRVLNRQIVVDENDSDPLGRYVSTLLNLRCRACLAEHFYDVSEISEMQGTPRPFSTQGHGHHAHSTHYHHAAHRN